MGRTPDLDKKMKKGAFFFGGNARAFQNCANSELLSAIRMRNG